MKKILSLIICMSLLCCAALVPVGAELNVSSEAIETLNALGILEGADDGDLMPGKVLTRAEFVTILMRVLRTDFENATVYFDDVSANHWAVSSVATACEMGIVKGKSERTFEPDAPLIFEEAIKMLVSALGYEPVAARKGGYPSGYLTVAQSIGLLDGISVKAGLIIRRDMAAEIIFNALDSKVVVDTGVGEDAASVTEKGVTLLSEKMKIEKGEGIISANGITSLAEAGGVSKNQVKIGDKIFNIGTSSAENLLGYAVTYYAEIKEGGDVCNLLYVRKDGKKNALTRVMASDILPETSEEKLVYLTEDDKTEEISFSVYADLIYNGAGVGAFLTDDMIPEYGYVEALDNNRDGEADVLFVYDFETVVVGSVSASDFKVYDFKDALTWVELDPESDDYSFVIYKDGEEVDFSAIKAGCTLLVAESKNTSGKKQIKVEISDKTITGTVLSIGDDTVTIDDTVHKVKSEKLLKAFKLLLNREVSAYIDALGVIAGVDEDVETAFEYGYLIEVHEKERFSKEVLFKVLMPDGKVSVLNGAKLISVDGLPAVDAKTASLGLGATVRIGGSGVEQIIRFKQNSKGEITAIDTTGPGKGNNDDTLSRDVDPSVRRRHYAGGFGATGSVAQVEFAVNSDTKVFLIPEASQKEDDTKYVVSGKSHFGNADYYYVDGYDMEDGCLKACVMQNTKDFEAKIATSVYPTIIEEITTTINVRGEETYKISGMYNGKDVMALAAYKDVINAKDPDTGEYTGVVFKVGDIVRWATNSDGEIIRIEPFLVGPDKDSSLGFTSVGTNVDRFYATFTCNYGFLTKKDGYNIVIDTDPVGEGTIRPFELTSSTPCFMFDFKKGDATTVTLNDLNEHMYEVNSKSRVAVIARNGSPNRIFIYKFD